jgi:uncharacterized protein YdhG (YjbR/CyaY superfamily)
VKKTNYQSIDEYIGTFPDDIQSRLESMRQIIKSVIPGAIETISYQIPTFKINNKNIVYFSAYKKHIGLYPGSSAIEHFKEELSQYKSSAIEHFKEELSQYKWSKAAVQFPLDNPIPSELVKKIVIFRARENQSQIKNTRSTRSLKQ